MGATVNFRLANGTEVEKMLGKIVDRARSPIVVYDWIADNVLTPALKGQIDTQGQRGGTPWPGYTSQEKIYYVPYKIRKLGKALPLLRWMGGRERLYPSFTQRNHPEHVRDISNRGVAVGSRVPYAENHDAGKGMGWRGKYQIPQRPIAVLTTRIDIAAIVEAFEQWIVDGKIKRGPVK